MVSLYHPYECMSIDFAKKFRARSNDQTLNLTYLDIRVHIWRQPGSGALGVDIVTDHRIDIQRMLE